jgi:hypothetical protein
MATNAGRAPGLTPMNGTAGAGLACGAFGLGVAIFLGFFSVPFALTAIVIGVLALVLSARGRAIGQLQQAESRVAVAGLIVGSLAMVVGLVGFIVR